MGYEKVFEKFVQPSGPLPPPPSYILNVRSFRDFIGILVIKSHFLFQNFPNEVFEISKMLKNNLRLTRKAC